MLLCWGYASAQSLKDTRGERGRNLKIVAYGNRNCAHDDYCHTRWIRGECSMMAILLVKGQNFNEVKIVNLKKLTLQIEILKKLKQTK